MITSRRHFLHRCAAVSFGFVGLRSAVASGAVAGVLDAAAPGPGFGPLRPDPMGLLDLPAGFSYLNISRTGEKMDDGLMVPGLHDGMAAFPGPDGLTILVRNHEIDPAHKDAPGPFGWHAELADRIDRRKMFDPGKPGQMPPRGGTTTLLFDTRNGKAPGRLVKHWMSLAGTERNCAGGPTPRNTWISCEETVARADNLRAMDHGWCFEVPATADIELADPVPLKAMGRFFHEACATNPFNGVVYLTEDRPDGVLYRFLPNDPNRLREGGRLQALVVAERPALDTRNWESAEVVPGDRMPVRWIDVEDVESPDDTLRYQTFERGAARLARAEGCWHGRGAVYIACTNGGKAQCGQIWRYIPCPPDIEGTPAENDIPGRLELFIESPGPGVMENADNITVAPWGDLIVCEDGSEERHLLGVTPNGEVYKLARNAMNGFEFAGACFSPDGSTLFVNLQRPGATLAITGPWGRRLG